MFAAEWGTGQVFLSMVYFFMIFIWIMLLFQVFIDLFSDHETGGVAKFLWVLFVLVLPFLGVFIYLIVRGGGMAERRMAAASAQQKAIGAYIQQTASNALAGRSAQAALRPARRGQAERRGVRLREGEDLRRPGRSGASFRSPHRRGRGPGGCRSGVVGSGDVT